jgi:hypothetical protein
MIVLDSTELRPTPQYSKAKGQPAEEARALASDLQCFGLPSDFVNKNKFNPGKAAYF